MKAFVGITDGDWFSFLSACPALDEVNFWQPSGAKQFRALEPNELFLFKLHAPRQFIVGGALFAYSTILPLSLAWDAFQEKNGAASLDEMRVRIAKYRRVTPDARSDYEVGCVLLVQPFFLSEADWIPAPGGPRSSEARATTCRLGRAGDSGRHSSRGSLAWWEASGNRPIRYRSLRSLAMESRSPSCLDSGKGRSEY
jgi:hypothetical protein